MIGGDEKPWDEHLKMVAKAEPAPEKPAVILMVLAELSAIGVLLTLVGLVGGYFWYAFSYDPELSHKAGWSALQIIEFHEPSKPFVSSHLRRSSDGRFAAISILGVGQAVDGPTSPPQGLPGTAWVLLNEHAADKTVLILPQFPSYRVSCAAVGRLPKAVPDIDRHVLKYLSATCT